MTIVAFQSGQGSLTSNLAHTHSSLKLQRYDFSMLKADQIGVLVFWLCSLDGLLAMKKRNSICFVSPPPLIPLPRVQNDTRTSCEFVWNDYPIKRLIYNWKLLKGADCFSVFS